jgi:hypothetical protein
MSEVNLGTRSLKPGELESPELEPAPIIEAPAPVVDPSPTPKGGAEAGKEKKEFTAYEKQLFERNKKLEAELEASRKNLGVETPKTEATPSVDPFSLAKTVASLKEYDATEIDYIATISKMKNISPEQAVQTPEVKLWLVGKRDQDYKNSKIPVPGGSGGQGSGMSSSDDIAKMTPEQHKQFERDYLSKNRNKGSGL